MTEPTGNVLVVGAGPTGLALAHSLLRQGFTPRIIDAGEGTSPESRALATHARTLEVLGESVANKLLEIGKPIDR
ncbi:MAG: FAD-dependent monooxygenase, partial [Myxococcota bacterium]|nr:FAD-dependent monooxygenase [Myxococcota bacterium]